MGASGASGLAAKHCVPCRGGVPPLAGQELQKFAAQFPEWKVIDGHHITKSFKFADFKKALDFVNRVGAVAEEEFHHPDIPLAWGSRSHDLHPKDQRPERERLYSGGEDRSGVFGK
jgi:4a-hydroxytetrahydrobiopterin dehydratase